MGMRDVVLQTCCGRDHRGGRVPRCAHGGGRHLGRDCPAGPVLSRRRSSSAFRGPVWDDGAACILRPVRRVSRGAGRGSYRLHLAQADCPFPPLWLPSLKKRGRNHKLYECAPTGERIPKAALVLARSPYLQRGAAGNTTSATEAGALPWLARPRACLLHIQFLADEG